MANPTNKWSQPVAPPAPMFFGKKERDLVKQVNDELAERVVGQAIAYYPISLEESDFNEIYGEALEKVSLPPIRVFAYVTVENEQTNERYGYEYSNKLTVNFHRKRLTADQDLYVRVGDYVQYGNKFYEIVKTYNDTRYYFGQVEHKFQISAECIEAREGAFRVEAALTRPTATSGAVGDTSAPAPRAAPYPPLDATYITVLASPRLPNERVLTAGAGITLVDGGANGAITIASTAGGDGIFTTVDASNAYTTSSVTLGAATTPTNTLTIVGSISASSTLEVVGDTTLGAALAVSGSSLFRGGMIYNRTAVTTNYSIGLTDYYLGVDTTATTVQLTVPAASTATQGQTFVVKDEGGNAATNGITVARSSTDTIDGMTSISIASSYGAVSLYTDGSNWFIY